MNAFPPIAIIGAGPCGLLSALLLARKGVRSVIYERRSGPDSHPRAMGITRRTGEIYRQLGLEEAIQSGSLPEENRLLAFWAKALVGEELGRTPVFQDHNEFSPCRPLHCPQTHVEKVLLEALLGEARVEIRWETGVRSIQQSRDLVTLSSFGSGESREEVYPWVIAADGASSFVRHALGIATAGPGDMGHFLNVMFRAPVGNLLAGREAILYQIFAEDFFEFFVSVNGEDLWLMHHFLQPGETADSYSPDQLAAIIRRAAGLPDMPVEILSVKSWVMSPKVADRFQEGRILLTGDAAARLSPAGGLGLNTGLQSAHNLAWKLALVIQGQADPELLHSYEQERQPVALKTMQSTNANATELFSIIQLAMEGRWAEVKEKIAHSRRGGSGLGLDLGTVYEQGAFLAGEPSPFVGDDPINDFVPSACPGGRAPHVWLFRRGQRFSILDLFGDGFVVLSGRYGPELSHPLVKTYQIGTDDSDELQDRDGSFFNLYDLRPEEWVLVRPDGVVAARSPRGDDPERSIQAVLQQILSGKI